MADTHTFDYSQITDNIFIGSDLCNGISCPIHGPEFEQLGVLAELNLSAEKKEIPPDGIDVYAWIPVGNKYPATQEQLDIGTAIINEAVTLNKKIFVHCKEGHGRSPMMVAAYLIRYKNMGIDDATNHIVENRKEVHLEDSQKEALVKFGERWKK